MTPVIEGGDDVEEGERVVRECLAYGLAQYLDRYVFMRLMQYVWLDLFAEDVWADDGGCI